jgi:hypothetical protein
MNNKKEKENCTYSQMEVFVVMCRAQRVKYLYLALLTIKHCEVPMLIVFID